MVRSLPQGLVCHSASSSSLTVVANIVRLILGDQLNPEHSWFSKKDPSVTYVFMEVRSETDYVVHHAQKVIAIFAGMRRMAEILTKGGHQVRYFRLSDKDNRQNFAENLQLVFKATKAARFEYQEPDEYRLDQDLRTFAKDCGLVTACVSSEHFLDGRAGVAAHFKKDAKRWLMESYYRRMRVSTRLLMDEDGTPAGGEWNYDKENRKPWKGTPPPPKAWDVSHDYSAIWAELQAAGVKTMGKPCEKEFPWPIDRKEALKQLDAFIERGLPDFGDYEDAMHTSSDRLFHSRLSFALNVKLLAPLEVAQAAADAHARDPQRYPLAATEGFVRQIIGWREYIRGVYWAKMPGYADANGLGHTLSLPSWFWTGKVKMNCMRHSVGQSLDTAYAHHIQRLMVTGLYALLLGVDPGEVHQWYLAVYVDAVEWVELPNTLGMSQYADGGVMGSKPYIATGKYIQRMGPHCKGCRYDPAQRSGDSACPFTTLYWDFLMRHEASLARNPRMALQVKNLARLTDPQKQAVNDRAAAIRRGEVGVDHG